jgi:hypothetical protein
MTAQLNLEELTLESLKPQGALEEIFAAEIIVAANRLRQCRADEAALAARELTPETRASEQKSIDRVRAQANNSLRRNAAELRRLQTECAVRLELADSGLKVEGLAPLADSRQVLEALKTWAKSRLDLRKADGLDTLEDICAKADRELGMKTSSFCKSAQEAANDEKTTPRNALCPCNSGHKFKRCCGKDAPPVLTVAA